MLTRRIVRLIAGIAFCLLWAVWGWHELRAGTQRESLRRAFEQDPTTLLENREQLTMPQSFLALASYASEDVFPPDRAAALQAAERAIAAEPLWSRPWMVLARERLLAGDDAGARRALDQADALEPRFPRQRLESVRLWTLLGEPRRGIEVAQAVGLLGDRYRLDAARELLLSGTAPADAFLLLGGPELNASEALRLAQALHDSRLDAMQALYAELPPSVALDSETRTELAALALDPLDADLVLALWNLEDQDVQVAPDGIPLANRELEAPPFFNRFPLGWVPPVERGGSRIAWQAAEEDGFSGRIRLDLPAFGVGVFRYDFYRFVLPAGEQRTLPVRVRSVPMGELECEVSARAADGTPLARVRLPPAAEFWKDVRLELPAADEPQLVTVILEVRRIGPEDKWMDAFVEIDRLGLPLAGGTP
ncbi:MAG: hypothetical protein PWP23_636 [Candidatus Sumerlaeota bacterium]|nr:hypothetical protein [Candidatus Sumerlaeota bacterium]